MVFSEIDGRHYSRGRYYKMFSSQRVLGLRCLEVAVRCDHSFAPPQPPTLLRHNYQICSAIRQRGKLSHRMPESHLPRLLSGTTLAMPHSRLLLTSRNLCIYQYAPDGCPSAKRKVLSSCMPIASVNYVSMAQKRPWVSGHDPDLHIANKRQALEPSLSECLSE